MKQIIAASIIMALMVPLYSDIGDVPAGTQQAALLPGGAPAPGIGFQVVDFAMDLEWSTPLLVEDVATGDITSVEVGVVGKVTVRLWHPVDGSEYRIEQSPDMVNWTYIPPVEIKIIGRVGAVEFSEVVLTVVDDPDTNQRQRQFFRVVKI